MAPSRRRRRFVALIGQPPSSIDLVEACGLVAEHLGHPVPAVEVLARVDGLASACASDIERRGRSLSLEAITEHLVGEAGFRGDRERYYDARNSLLPDVLARRVGIPITLAVVVIGVAGRLGVVATGVGMPGHFLVGDGHRPARWFDAFEGRWLDASGAEARFRAVHGNDAAFDPAYLAPTPAAQIVGRVLSNLAHVHRSTGDPTALVRTMELLAAVPGLGTTPRVQAELAAALVAVGRIDDAAAVLEAVQDRIEPRRRASVAAQVEQLRANLN